MTTQKKTNHAKHKKSEEQEKAPIDQPKLVDVGDTAIIECLDVVKNEYQTERNKKQSFENRAGLVMALLGVICIILFEKIQLRDIYDLTILPLTFLNLLIIFSGTAAYFGFLFTMIELVKTISVKAQDNFEVKNIDESLLSELRISALCKIIFTYRDIILQHRALNEKRATMFKKSLYGISFTLISMIVYITLI